METILLMPVILMLLYAIAQYSLIFLSIQMFNYAAEESLRNSISYVDENCYYGGTCDETELKNQIDLAAKSVITNYTESQSGLGTLFGQSLDTGLAISVDSNNFCCKVTITYNYKQHPFLPSFGLPVPDELKSTATLNL
ncbi:TadE family protein [Photobacterium sp. 1_MG-2023]|uniref:TadE family protein n=1 Tax=Photobacterium sp. 1_MG-2023 TaxID=3062646 RepID=UPI0026E2402A|nr:TadE family protein [Photobacterium sp. 1_MG-2023]MDO6708200.1 pilus assembly protein [Photobacterium sp. 1_MG-2023]